MRQVYDFSNALLGATLIDHGDPSKVIQQRSGPRMMPAGGKLALNLAFSCGRITHNDILITPFAMSDMYSGFATVPPPDELPWRVCRRMIES